MIREFLAASIFVTAATAGERLPLPLWPGIAPGSENTTLPEQIAPDPMGGRAISHIGNPALVPFYAEHPIGISIIVSPGGAYRAEMFDREGTEVAHWLNTLGVDAYVLKYRLPSEPQNKGDAPPLQDIQRAIRLVRSQTSHPARRVGTMGFSAGGNLTALSAVYYGKQVYDLVDSADTVSARPDFFAVIYGFIPRLEDLALAGFKPDSPTYKYMAKYLFELAVTADTPPAFVIHGDADTHVPSAHGQRIKVALSKAGVACEYHLIKGANHGFALRAIGEDKEWPGLFAVWLNRLAK